MREPISFSGAAGKETVAAGVRLSVGQPWLTFERCLVQARTPGHTRIRIASQSSRLYVALGIGRQKTLVAGAEFSFVNEQFFLQ